MLHMPAQPTRRRRSLARQLLILQLAVVAITVAIGALVTVMTAREKTEEQERERVLAVAETLARAPGVTAALETRRPSRALQPLAERVRRDTGVAFVVVMSPQGIRYTHPSPARIGGRFVGDIAPAVRGRAFTETYTGTLGPSVRAVAPVQRGGRVVGLVAVGVLRERIADQLVEQIPRLAGLAALALLAGTVLSLLLARRVKRQTLGLEPRQIVKLYEHHDAVLHAIREGVLVLDSDRRLLLANDEARRLLELPGDVESEAVRDAIPEGPLQELLASGRTTVDEVQLVGDRVLLVSQRTASVDGRPVGAVVTLRDRTELQALTRELDAVRGMADSLRAQAHESANQLHTIVGLVELGRYEEAVEFATERVEIVQELLHRLQVNVQEPALVALLLGKAALARELGIELAIAEDAALVPTTASAADLVTIVGNLLDNAFDAVAAGARGPARVELELRPDGDEVVLEVRDNGPGFALQDAERIFQIGWTTKAARVPGGRGLGLGLVRQVVTRLGGRIEARSDQGAIFTVTLPVAAPARPLTGAEAT
jgi:two-component system, CitB family, sensor kinase